METQTEFFSPTLTSFGHIPIISTDDIDLAFQTNDTFSHNISGHSDMVNWTKITTPPANNTTIHMFKTPQIHSSVFKLPQPFRTPSLASLLNTPRNYGFLKGFDIPAILTPCPSQRSVLSNCESFVIPTPMIFSSLKFLTRPSTDISTDILQLIDDDSKDVNYVDNKLEDAGEINDNNIVDYVLDITEPQPTTNCPAIQEAPDPPIYIKRRKGRHAKRMTEEESKAYRERQRQTQKERRKERLGAYTQEEKGITRRSKRSQKRVSYKV